MDEIFTCFLRFSKLSLILCSPRPTPSHIVQKKAKKKQLKTFVFVLDAWIKILLKGGRGLTPIQALLSNFLFKFGYYEHFFAAYFPHQKKFLVGVRELVEGGGHTISSCFYHCNSKFELLNVH